VHRAPDQLDGHAQRGRGGGDSDGNARAETTHGLFETELVRRRGRWRRAAAVARPLAGVAWFDPRRLLEPIGHVPPAAAEARHHAGREATAWAA
jgi:hypothetical protein